MHKRFVLLFGLMAWSGSMWLAGHTRADETGADDQVSRTLNVPPAVQNIVARYCADCHGTDA